MDHPPVSLSPERSTVDSRVVTAGAVAAMTDVGQGIALIMADATVISPITNNRVAGMAVATTGPTIRIIEAMGAGTGVAMAASGTLILMCFPSVALAETVMAMIVVVIVARV